MWDNWRIRQVLTVKRIERLDKAGRYGDGGGLYLRVAPGGSKQWILRVVAKGRRRDIGLGGYPHTSLSEARDRAYDCRRLARRGGDPMAMIQSSHVPAFGEAAQRTLEAHSDRWAASTAATWMAPLEAHCRPLWTLPVDGVSKADVIGVFKAAGKQSIVDKLKVRVKQVFDWAVAYGYCEANPVPLNGELKAAMPNAKRAVAHHAALPYAELPAFYAALPTTASGRCMAFLILTATRSNEARGCRWSEIDTEAATWTIPGERMKSRREHRIPLSADALAILAGMPRRGEFVFPGRTGGELSDESLRQLAKRANATTHGMRASFSTWGAEAGGIAESVIEHALAHVTGNTVSRSYNRSTYLEARRDAMAKWAKFVTLTYA